MLSMPDSHEVNCVLKPERVVQLDANNTEFVTGASDSNDHAPRKINTASTIGTLTGAVSQLEKMGRGLLAMSGADVGNQSRRARKTMAANSPTQESWLRRTVKSTYFEVFFALVILANA